MSEDYFFIYGNEKPAAGRRRMQYLPPEEEEAQTRSLAAQTFGAIETLGKILDTPGSIARGALADEPLSGFSWDTDARVSGEDLLDKMGVQYDNPYLKSAAGLGLEIMLDPLNAVTGPMKALGAAGRAADAAGLLHLAPAAAAKKMGGYSQAAKTMTGRFVDDLYRRSLPEISQQAGQPAVGAVSDALKVRPLLGPRLSRSMTTLDDVVQMADNKTEAMSRIQDFLDANRMNYDDIKDQNLGGLMGLGFGTPSTVWNPSFAAPVLDAMDMVGARASWSPIARYGSAWFDKRMNQQSGIGDQLDMMRMAAREADEVEAGRRAASRYLSPFADIDTGRALGPDGLRGVEGGRMLTRMFEDAPMTAADKRMLRTIAGLKGRVDEWDAIRDAMAKEAKGIGLPSKQYGDQYGVKYTPHYAAEIVYAEPSAAASRSIFNTRDNSDIGRVWYLKTPGGRDELRDISTLPFVREHARLKGDSPYSNEQIGQGIADWMEQQYGQKVMGTKQGTMMAQFLRNLNPDIPKDYPVFAEHPLNAQARLMINHRRNVARAEFALDKLSETAVQAYPSNIRGGGWQSLERAARDASAAIGMVRSKSGGVSKAVREQLIDRIAQRFPHMNRADIDLSKMSVPQSVYDRLTRVNQVFQSPKAWKDVWSMFEKFTTVFKAFVLAWPSRHVRDAYSNAFSIWLETGNASDTMLGMNAASKFLAGDFDAAIPMLRQLPKYSRLATDDAVRLAFAEDAGATGILSTLASSDLLSARRQAAFTELVPGSSPVRMSDAVQEMIPDGSRSPVEMAKDFFTIQGVSSQWNTKNPLLNASQKINDANDSIARLGGFIALMKQGVAPDQAAERITRALVDYSSTTDIERSVFKVVFPWWTYSSRMGKYVVQHLLERPGGRYGQMIRSMNTLQQGDEDDPYIPTALRQQFAMRVPDALLPYIGREPGGDTTTYFKDLDLPGVDVLSLFVPGNVGLDVSETLQNLAQQSHPLARTTAEMATGLDFFSKRPLDEAVTPLDRIYQAAFGTKTRLSPTAKAVIQNIPGIQRLISLGGGLSDQRIPFEDRVLKQAINNLTGVKIQDVDPDWMYSDISRKISRNLKGYMSSKPIDFIPEELQPEVPPHLIKQYMLKKAVDRKAAEYKKQKRAAKEFEKK